MYIEVLHDSHGNIAACWCADTLPRNNGSFMFSVQGGVPAGYEQARINIDTVTAMEIEAASGQKAVMDISTGQPGIINVDRAEHVMQAFKADVTREITPPAGALLPAGMKIRGIIRK